MTEAIRVNFGRPMPVFPLPDAVLLPHAIQPLHVFEQRYRQLVNDCLDGSGQIAIAAFAGVDAVRVHAPEGAAGAVALGRALASARRKELS